MSPIIANSSPESAAVQCKTGYRQHRHLLGVGRCAVSNMVQPSGTGRASAAVRSQAEGRPHRCLQGIARYAVSEWVQPARATATGLPQCSARDGIASTGTNEACAAKHVKMSQRRLLLSMPTNQPCACSNMVICATGAKGGLFQPLAPYNVDYQASTAWPTCVAWW